MLLDIIETGPCPLIRIQQPSDKLFYVSSYRNRWFEAQLRTGDIALFWKGHLKLVVRADYCNLANEIQTSTVPRPVSWYTAVRQVTKLMLVSHCISARETTLVDKTRAFRRTQYSHYPENRVISYLTYV